MYILLKPNTKFYQNLSICASIVLYWLVQMFTNIFADYSADDSISEDSRNKLVDQNSQEEDDVVSDCKKCVIS